jgi:hypothetical protein
MMASPEEFTVFMPSIQFNAGAHSAALRILAVVLTMLHIQLAESFGKEYLDGLAEQFIREVPEHLFHLRVDANDAAILVGNRDCTGNGVEQDLEERVARLELFIGLFMDKRVVMEK